MQSSANQEFLDRIIALAEKDARLVGVGVHQETDQEKEFTNLEVVLLTSPENFPDVANDLVGVAEALGPLLLVYEQGKEGPEAELACLYEEPLQRVDLRLLPTDNLSQLHAPRVLWERDEAFAKALAARRDLPPAIDLQWMEDRFWMWTHCAATALQQGSIFEALHLLSCIRARILGPLLLEKEGRPLAGLHELERAGGDELSSLRATVPLYDARSCELSLREAAKLYVGLRETLAPENLLRHRRAEMAVMRHLHQVTERLSA